MESTLFIINGVWVTLLYSVVSVGLGLILGSLLSLGKLSTFSVLRGLVNAYISVFRGTPLLVQLSLIYFAIPGLTGFEISVFAAGVAAFSLNSAAYVAEIIRAGIESVDKGQFEAAKALGVPYSSMMKDIILPQAVRFTLPALVNEVVNLLKESAIISVIGGADLMRRSQIVAAETYSYFEPLLTAAACYYVLVLIMSAFAKLLENKLKLA